MKRTVFTTGTLALIAAFATQSVQAGIISVEAELTGAAAKGRFNKRISGGEYITKGSLSRGGNDTSTSAFPAPVRENTQANSNDPNAGPASAADVPTVWRFQDLGGATLAPGIHHFGLEFYCIGQQLDVTGTWYDNFGEDPTGAAGVAVPGLSVEALRLTSSSVQVTVSNDSATDSVDHQGIGYLCTALKSGLTAADLTSANWPSSAFVSLAPAGTMAPGASSVFVVAAGLQDDVVVNYSASFTGGSPNAATSNNWHAVFGGGPINLQGPNYGRFIMQLNLDTAIAALPVADMKAKGPFKVIQGTAGAPTAAFQPGDPDADGFTQILIDTTAAGSVAKSYLRSKGCDIYSDVKVRARVEPGAAVGQADPFVGGRANILSSDDGGPVAIRVQPGGGSYYAWTGTGQSGRISIMKEDTSGGTSELCGSSTWDSGAAIAIAYNPVADGGAFFIENNYEVCLSASGTTISLTVTELKYDPFAPSGDKYIPTGEVLNISCVNSSYSQGYVGIRSERDGSLDAANGYPTIDFEGSIKDWEIIRVPTPSGPLSGLAIMTVGGSDTRTDSVVGWASRGSRAGVQQAGRLKQDYLSELGAIVTNVGCGEWKNAPYGFPAVESQFDIFYLDGGCGSTDSRSEARCFQLIPQMWGEHVVSRAEWTGMSSTNTSGDSAPPEALNLARVKPAADGGDPTHPIVSGFPVDGSDLASLDGTNVIKFYPEPCHHIQNQAEPQDGVGLVGMGFGTFNGEFTVQTGVQAYFDPGTDLVRRHVLSAFEAGNTKGGPEGAGALCADTTFAQRNVWCGWGDYAAGLSACGKTLYQRSFAWLSGTQDGTLASAIPFTDCDFPSTSATPPSVPAMSSWGLAAMTLLLGAVGVTVVLRRRQVIAA